MLEQNRNLADQLNESAVDLNDRLAASQDARSTRFARQTPEERKRRFDEQRKMIDTLDAEDELKATKAAMELISKKERILSLSKERAASRGKSGSRPQTAPQIDSGAREPS